MDSNLSFVEYSKYLKEMEKGRSIVIGQYSTESENCPDIFRYDIDIDVISNHPYKVHTLWEGRID